MTGSDFQPSASQVVPSVSFSQRVLAIVVMTLAAAELFRIFVAQEPASLLSRAAFVLLCLALVARFSLRESVMASMAAFLAIGLVARGDTADALFALDRAAFFAGFIYLVTLLKEAASRSRSVLALGVFLTQQPQGRRYYSISVGSHILGVLLNFGAVSLLTPLIQRGVRESTATHPNGDQLERQQISALLRGFSWMILWAPTALTQAVLFTSFPGAEASTVIPLGLAASVVMILIGRHMDRTGSGQHAVSPTSEVPTFPLGASARFGLICLCLIAFTLTLALLAKVSAALALMLIAPLVMTLWVFAQHVSTSMGRAFTRSFGSLREIFILGATDPARSAFVLGTAGFIGQATAALAPVEVFADGLDPSMLPAWVFLASLPIIITLGGQLALSPIMVVVFISAVINELPTLPADPSLIVFALGAGWALSMTASPNASATLLIAAITKIAPTTLTWRWNGRYACACYLCFLAAFMALTALE